ncbi:cytochrome c biogenesis protein CcdA [Pyruvatibacter sp.]|uniref:cytochrome c biogenesis CcdA family protein n=1 Tax=Pyruvatibacter sp. TaxID=1981328 RepID=UPI0032EEBE8E
MDTGSITYLAAFAGGLISFLSPCVLPLVPAYLSYMAGTTFEALQENDDAVTRRTVIGAAGFVLGFSTVFVALGATASVISPLILANKVMIGYIAGAVIVILGLHYMGLFRIALLDREMRMMPATLGGPADGAAADPPSPAMQALAPYGIGLAFGFGWTPCIGPILATILSIAASRDDLAYGVSLLSVYSLGLGLPFMMAALGVRTFLAFSQRFRKHMHKVEIAAGVLLVGTGLLIFFGSLETIAYWLIDLFPVLGRLG